MTLLERALVDVVTILDDLHIQYMLIGGVAFEVLVQDAPAFIRDTRVLPLQTSSGVRVDLVSALIPGCP